MQDYDAPVQQRKITRRTSSWSSTAWITDDCAVKICRDGYISVTDYDGYQVAYRCPRCDRWDAPSIRRYNGLVELHSAEEMEKRRKEREEIVYNAQKRMEMRGKLLSGWVSVE